jgi:hypothetical protein
MSNKTPEQGMEEAAKGMSDKQLNDELNRLNKMETRTQGQEEARKIIEQESDKRHAQQR